MTLPRVVYLGAPPGSGECAGVLIGLPCEVVHETLFGDRPGWNDLPDYDLGLNFLAPYKVPEEHVVRPRLGWVNFHPAPLPEFGGRNVAYHAIESGAKEFGATVHYMDAAFDTGPIIECVRFPITPAATAGDLMNASIEVLKLLFKKWVPELLKGRVPATPQPPGGMYYSKHPGIVDVVNVTPDQERAIRARTFHSKHHAVLVVGGRRYKVIPEGQDA